MKNTFKKLICLLLAFTLVLGAQAPALAEDTAQEPEAEEAEVSGGVYGTPIINVSGQRDIIYSQKDDIESETYLTNGFPDGALGDVLDGISDELIDGFLTSDWDGFCDALYEALSSYLAPLALDENGNIPNNTGYDCIKETAVTDKAVNGRYRLNDYDFVYDWRLDPVENAVELNSYIRSVKAATGAEKVDILASGIGYSTLLAYLYTFGYDDIKECVLCGAGLNGIDTVGMLFSGRMVIDEDALNRYLQENLSDTDPILALAQYAADLVLTNGFADSMIGLVSRIYKLIYENVLPRILLSSYGTMPGYWSLVGDKYYEDAKALHFGTGEDTEETEEAEENEETAVDYTYLIKKLDRFHNEILNNASAIISDAVNSGVNVYDVVRYGHQIVPLNENSSEQSDGIISVGNATFGAEYAPYGEKLSDEVIENAKTDGSILFISPDHEIDASAASLKKHTWFIKNVSNDEDPAPAAEMIEKILDTDGYVNVFDLEDYPQYLVCNNAATRMDKLTETGVIAPTFDEQLEEYFSFDSPTGIMKKLFSLIAKFVELLRYLIDSFRFDEW